MFKNNVFKASVDTKQWFKATAVRAIKTVAQTALATNVQFTSPIVALTPMVATAV